MERAVVVGPVIFTLTGGAVGICFGMLYRSSPTEFRVRIDDSMPLLLGGACLGFLLGWGVQFVCQRWARVLPTMTVIATTLLGAAITAMFGWMFVANALMPYPREGMAIGGVLGASCGFALGMSQVFTEVMAASKVDEDIPAE